MSLKSKSLAMLGLLSISSVYAMILENGSYTGGNVKCEASANCSLTVTTLSAPTVIINSEDSILSEDELFGLIDEIYMEVDKAKISIKLASYLDITVSEVQQIVEDLYHNNIEITLENIKSSL